MIYFVRHQLAGIVWEYPFAETPSAEHIAAVAAEADRVHGATHRATGEKCWTRVVGVPVVAPGAAPAIPEPPEPTKGSVGVPTVRGVAKMIPAPPEGAGE